MSLNDPALRSFVAVPPDHPFPIQNLPFGAFRRNAQTPRLGVAIGDHVLDLATAAQHGLLPIDGLATDYFTQQQTLNDFMARGGATWRATRQKVSELLRRDNPKLRDDAALRDKALIPRSQVEM